MSLLKDDVYQSAKEAVLQGDTRRLAALAKQFPETFELLKDRDLLDLAVEHNQTETAIALIIRYGFEFSPDFRKHEKEFGGDLFAEGVNEYKQTLEYLADAILGETAGKVRGASCYQVKGLLQDAFSTQWSRNPSKEAIKTFHPEFIRLAADGSIARFVQQKKRDERFRMSGSRHYVSMLNVLEDSLSSLQAAATSYLGEHPELPPRVPPSPAGMARL